MLTLISQFDGRYRCLEAKNGNDLENWYASKVQRLYSVTSVGTKKAGPTGVFAETKIGQFNLATLSWGRAMQSVLQENSDRISITVPVNGSSQVIDPHFGKLSCAAEQARIFRLDAGVTVNSSPGYARLNMTIPVDLLEARARNHYDTELDAPLRFDPIIDFTTSGGMMIKNLITYLLTQAVHCPEAARNPLIEAGFSEMVLSHLLQALAHTYSKEGSIAVDAAIPMIIRRAEDFMRAHAAEPITVEMIARHAGCSERALQNGFKSFYGTSPITRLRDIRLTYARADIEQENDTIASVAYKWGFSNLGRFAAQYAERFGEHPHQTLGSR